MTIVVCLECGKFYNGDVLVKCPFCGSTYVRQPTKKDRFQ